MKRVLFAFIFVLLISGAASAQTLSEALDTNLIITTGGGRNWFSQTDSYISDGDAARSGNISHNQESWMQTTVIGDGTLSFYWKVSSEENYDVFEFYIDGSMQDRISGTEEWHRMIYTISTSGVHTLQWRYVKDTSIDRGDDSGWVDKLEWSGEISPPAGPLSDALDTSLTFTTDGDVKWFAQNSITFFDGDAAQSGDVTDNQNSWIRTTITGAGTLSFYWKVSSEAGYDFLEFYIDGILQEQISGLVDWHQMIYEFDDSGEHALGWRYVKDYSESKQDDTGWVDLVVWSGSAQPPSVGPLSEALDTNLDLTTSGDADWFAQTDMAFFGGDAAQSGIILENQESLMQTMVSGEGVASFYWKVSSEAGYDFLEFYIDGALQDSISGAQDWQQMIYPITSSGVHTLQWRYVKDKTVSAGSDSGWVDQLEWSGEAEPPAGPLAEAVDSSLEFTTDGDAEWFTQTTVTFFGDDAAQSGDISDEQSTLLRTIVDGNGTFSFYWKVSSEAGYDFLEFYIDGILQHKISGLQDWQQMVYTINEPGSHTLEWRYVKDYSESKNDDNGWIDLVEWTGGTQPPSAGPLSDALDTSLVFNTGGDAEWFSQTTVTFFGGDAAQSGDVAHNQESFIQTTVNDAGTLSFYWKVSSEAGYDFLEFYIDGVLQDRISGLEDWNQMTYTITESGSHNLEWRYVKDYSETIGDDVGWVDLVEWSGGSEPPSVGPLSDAMDTSLSFSTSGDAEWFSQTLVAFFDGDAAQSGDISDNQESLIQTTVSGSGTLSFYWKVSSEANYDFIEFYIDGSMQDRISGLQDWQKMIYTVTGSGLHTLEWRYVKDWSESTGDDTCWVDLVEWSGSGTKPPSGDGLSAALDTSLNLTTGGNADWFSQNTVFYNDLDAAQSGLISHNQESWMQTTVNGPVNLSFYWKVSSEPGYDTLEFYINDLLYDSITGSVDWRQVSYLLPPGQNVLKWRYVKDWSVTEGDDSGWVDALVVD